MFDTNPKSYDSDDKINLAALEAENKLLRKECGELRQQSESVAEANAHAAELMVKLEEVNNDLKIEIERRKLAEEKLQHAHDELEVKVKERTAELAATVERLTIANRELKDFMHIASHDLREPLRKISLFGRLLKDSLKNSLADDDKENLEFVIGGADRMTHLVAGIRTYSELASSQVLLENVDLKEIVNHLVETDFSAILKETGGTIEIQQLIPSVKANPVQMRLLLRNLIDNGIKYRHNQVIPKIVIRAKSTAAGKIRIEVQDNGIGIKEEYHEYIFKIFKRLHLQQEYQGIGMGLTLCKKILDKHDGEIGVESKYGEGSTFWFTLSPAEELAAVET